MWCRHCQQETPALGPITQYGARCPRCNRTEKSVDSSGTISATNSIKASEFEEFAPETSDTARRHIQRSLKSAESTVAAGKSTSTFRVDLGTLELPEPFSSTGESYSSSTTSLPSKPLKENNLEPSPIRNPLPRKSVAALRSQKRPSKKSTGLGQILGWGIATCGALLLGFGIGLIVWATYGGRTLLWGPAIATTIAGQGLMIVGLLHLLANLWSAARHTNAKLTQIHDDLRRVRRTTEEAAGRQHPTATGFYAELSGGATSDVLLGNLRGQLDQLSSRIRIDR